MSAAAAQCACVPESGIERRIYVFRGERVMLADLAELYGVPTKRLNEAVRRNRARFPADFLFELTPQEIWRGCWRRPAGSKEIDRPQDFLAVN